MKRNSAKKGTVTGGERLPSTLQILIYSVIHCVIYFTTNRICLLGEWQPFYCRLDEIIPIVKWFVIPYCMWFPQIAGTLIWFFVRDYDSLRRFMKYIMISTIPVYFVFIFFPTCMPLRPSAVEGEDVLSILLNLIFAADNSTNIFPSLHVIWSVGSLIALWNDSLLSRHSAKTAATILTTLVCVSTFMIKQHSILDTIGAIPFCLLGWFFTYRDAALRSATVSSD